MVEVQLATGHSIDFYQPLEAGFLKHWLAIHVIFISRLPVLPVQGVADMSKGFDPLWHSDTADGPAGFKWQHLYLLQ